tara:strand:- start:4391 stop:4759 length:369 start_codon:yes stop_codon:yes gene_type:complete
MNKSNLIKIIQLAYLSAINDIENDCEQWCEDGSMERSAELLDEFASDRTLGFQMYSNNPVSADSVEIIKSASRELMSLIDDKNLLIKSKICSTDLEEPDYHDYQTCYELSVMAKTINDNSIN